MLCARNHCSAALRSHRPLEIAARACRGASWRSKSPLEHAFSCSATPANAAPALALGAAARASVVGFDNTFAFPADTFQNSCRNRCASNSALFRAVLCATPQAPSGAICGSSIIIYIYIIILEFNSSHSTSPLDSAPLQSKSVAA